MSDKAAKWLVLDGHCIDETGEEKILLAGMDAAEAEARERAEDQRRLEQLTLTAAFLSRVLLCIGIVSLGWEQTLIAGCVMGFIGVYLHMLADHLETRREEAEDAG